MYDFNFKRNPWILCYKGIPSSVDTFFTKAGKNFTQIYMDIIKKKRRQMNFFARWNTYIADEVSLEELKSYMKIAIKNQRLRSAFTCIARRWLQARLRRKNEEDLMTGEEPVESVTIVDWPTRSIYDFEAKTISRDMVSRLLMATWMFFPSPKFPRNPYTNEPLTEGQFYAVMKQLRCLGKSHWTLEALYSAKYNMEEFEHDMYMKLKRTHHNAIFANPATENAKEILLEFIEDEHKTHGIDYEKEIYVWAANNQSHHHKIHEWRIQCEKYYRIQHFPSDKDKDDAEKEKIDSATKRLCAYPLILVERYNAAHEKKYVAIADRHAAAAQAEIINIQYVNINDANLAVVFAIFAGEEQENEEPHAALQDGNDTAEEAD
jgi:hypothetical protein